METIQEHDQIILMRNLKEFGLCLGDIGTVVLVHQAGRGYEVEFLTLDGKTIGVTTLMADEIRPIGSREVAHARLLNT